MFPKHNNGQNNFTIIYNNNVCNDVGREIYKDHMFSYTLPYYETSTIKIKFESNEEMSLKQALDSKKKLLLNCL